MPIEKIKVLHVIARFNIGGTARYLAYLLPNLVESNVEVLLAVGKVQEGEVEDSSLEMLNFKRVENLGRRIKLISDLKSYFELRKIVKEYKPDIINSHTFKSGLLCRLMYFHIPKVHTFHGHLLKDPEFSKLALKIIILLERILGMLTRKLVVTGTKVGTELAAVKIGQESQFTSIPGEVKLGKLKSRNAARKDLGLDTRFTVLWAARVVSVKNPKLLVEVAQLMPECNFLMAGEGIELDLMRELAPPNLKILGFIDISDVLLASDIFLSTSLNEGVPYSVMEAQSAGLPVIAVNCGALGELVVDGINGYLVEPVPTDIVGMISKLRENQELKIGMGNQSLRSQFNSANKPTFTQAYIELYKEILEIC